MEDIFAGRLYLTVNETCRALNVSRSTLYRWLARGELRAARAGDALRIPVEDVRSMAVKMLEPARTA